MMLSCVLIIRSTCLTIFSIFCSDLSSALSNATALIISLRLWPTGALISNFAIVSFSSILIIDVSKSIIRVLVIMIVPNLPLSDLKKLLMFMPSIYSKSSSINIQSVVSDCSNACHSLSLLPYISSKRALISLSIFCLLCLLFSRSFSGLA